MTLTLEVTDSTGGQPVDATHVFTEDGGTIGRAPTNAWVLPHNKVSGLHARISFRNGKFFIEDTSRNGVAVNAPDNRLVRERPYPLKSGDRLFIEPYEIRVWIEETGRPAAAATGDPFAEVDPFAAPIAAAPSTPLDAIVPSSPLSADLDPLKFFDPVGGQPLGKGPELPVDHAAGLGQHYQPPVAVPDPALPPPAVAPAPPPSPVAIPAGYNPLADDPIEPIAPPPRPGAPRPRPGDSSAWRRKRDSSKSSALPIPSGMTPAAKAAAPPVPPPAPPAASPPIEAQRSAPIAPQPASVPAPAARVPASPSPSPPVAGEPPASAPGSASPLLDLAALLAGSGIPDAVVTPELMRNLGEILRVVVAGLMDVLQSRQRIKEEFRMQQTLFRPTDNNPLKFSVNVEDALHNLLVKRNPAYLRPVDAFADAFDDLRDHQLAMLAGMRVAFDAMLAAFDPDVLQQQFDAQLGKSSLGLMPAKLRYWELFRTRRAELVKDPEAAFERLFGEEFRRAYEEQFRHLKAQRRTRGGRGGADPAAERS